MIMVEEAAVHREKHMATWRKTDKPKRYLKFDLLFNVMIYFEKQSTNVPLFSLLNSGTGTIDLCVRMKINRLITNVLKFPAP